MLPTFYSSRPESVGPRRIYRMNIEEDPHMRMRKRTPPAPKIPLMTWLSPEEDKLFEDALQRKLLVSRAQVARMAVQYALRHADAIVAEAEAA